jgi:hypothetical protein
MATGASVLANPSNFALALIGWRNFAPVNVYFLAWHE